MAEHIRSTCVNRDMPVVSHFNETGKLYILLTDPEDDRSTYRRRECEKY